MLLSEQQIKKALTELKKVRPKRTTDMDIIHEQLILWSNEDYSKLDHEFIKTVFDIGKEIFKYQGTVYRGMRFKQGEDMNLDLHKIKTDIASYTTDYEVAKFFARIENNERVLTERILEGVLESIIIEARIKEGLDYTRLTLALDASASEEMRGYFESYEWENEILCALGNCQIRVHHYFFSDGIPTFNGIHKFKI